LAKPINSANRDELSALTSTQGLSGLTTVGVALRVRGNPALESLRGLDRLTAGSKIDIFDNDGLVDLCGLHGLTVVDSLAVIANDGLRTLWGAHNLERAIVEVDITANDGLVDLIGRRAEAEGGQQ